MALTHAQRTSMFNTLAEVMGQDDAETLMQHLPPSGWDNVATKEDLRAGLAELTSAMTAGFAQAAVDRGEITKAMTEGLAQAAVERAEITKAMTEGLAQAAVDRGEITKAMTEGLAQAAVERAELKVQFTTELAEAAKRQAWHLYVMVSTIVLASVSIWIALITLPGP